MNTKKTITITTTTTTTRTTANEQTNKQTNSFFKLDPEEFDRPLAQSI